MELKKFQGPNSRAYFLALALKIIPFARTAKDPITLQLCNQEQFNAKSSSVKFASLAPRIPRLSVFFFKAQRNVSSARKQKVKLRIQGKRQKAKGEGRKAFFPPGRKKLKDSSGHSYGPPDGLTADFLMILLGRQQTFLSVASSGGLRNAPKYLVTFSLQRCLAWPATVLYSFA